VDHQTAEDKQGTKRVRGFTAVGVSLVFGMSTASLAGTTLLWSGTFLDQIWVLNPTGYGQLARLGRSFGGAFILQLDGFSEGYCSGVISCAARSELWWPERC